MHGASLQCAWSSAAWTAPCRRMPWSKQGTCSIYQASRGWAGPVGRKQAGKGWAAVGKASRWGWFRWKWEARSYWMEGFSARLQQTERQPIDGENNVRKKSHYSWNILLITFYPLCSSLLLLCLLNMIGRAHVVKKGRKWKWNVFFNVKTFVDGNSDFENFRSRRLRDRQHYKHIARTS